MKQLFLLVLMVVAGCCGGRDEALTMTKLHEAIAVLSSPPMASDGTPYKVFEQLNAADQSLDVEELGHQFPHLVVSGQPLDWDADKSYYRFAGTDVQAMWVSEHNGDTLVGTWLCVVTRRDGDKWQQFDPTTKQWVETDFVPSPEGQRIDVVPQEAEPEADSEKPKIKVKSVGFTKQRMTTRILIADFSPRAGRPYYNGNTGQLTVVEPVYLEGETTFVDQDLLRLAREKATVELEFNLQFTQRDNLRIVRRVTKR